MDSPQRRRSMLIENCIFLNCRNLKTSEMFDLIIAAGAITWLTVLMGCLATAKRLRNAAQRCRAAGYVGKKGETNRCYPEGVGSSATPLGLRN